MTIRQEALIRLLSLPDEECLHRGYRYTLPRDPKKNVDEMKRDLGTAYVEWRRYDGAIAKGQECSSIVSVQRFPLLKLVKRA